MRFSALRRDRARRRDRDVPARSKWGLECVALYIVPLSATMPSASAPLVVIGPDEATVTPPLLMPGPPPLLARARMPMPPPPSVVIPGPV